LTVGVLLDLYNHFITFLSYTHPRHGGNGRGVTRKCENHEAPRNTHV